MSGSLTIEQVRENVTRSRGHIAKQEAIITRLTGQGHTAMAEEACRILVSMREHIEIELKMLSRMEAAQPGS